MNFGQFSGKSAEERAFEQLLEAKQMKDFLKMYAGLVDRCFTDCCNDFTSQKLTSKEETCVTKCTEKFLKHSERVGQRFSEQNALLQQQQMQGQS